MGKNVLEFALESEKSGKKLALVTITQTRGSSPASEGQMIAVLEDGTAEGTVGGGASENEVCQIALAAIKSGMKTFEFEIDHAELGMVCGGGLKGYGTVLGNTQRLLIFGGGHISQSLARLALLVGFLVTVVEDRPEFAANFPQEAEYVACSPEEYKGKIRINPETYVVVCTRGHNLDYDSLTYAMSYKNSYIGMIGSRSKVSTLINKLLENGFEKAEIENLYTPIGLDIASEKPAEIAVAILAEILKIKNDGRLEHKKNI